MEKLSCEKFVFNFPFSFYLWLSADKDPTLSRPYRMLLYNGFIMVIVFFLANLVHFSYTSNVLSVEKKIYFPL